MGHTAFACIATVLRSRQRAHVVSRHAPGSLTNRTDQCPTSDFDWRDRARHRSGWSLSIRQNGPSKKTSAMATTLKTAEPGLIVVTVERTAFRSMRKARCLASRRSVT
jgi:uncharacterized protein (DUF2249 family)